MAMATPMPDGAAAAPRRRERERDRDQRHDEVDERERQLRVELDEVLAHLVPALPQLGDVRLQLEEAHRSPELLDLREVVDVLRHRDALAAKVSLHTRRGRRCAARSPSVSVPAVRRPVRLLGVEAVDERKSLVDLEQSSPSMDLSTGSSSAMRKKRVSDGAVPDLALALEVARELAADLHAVHLLRLGVELRQRGLLEHHGADADDAAP